MKDLSPAQIKLMETILLSWEDVNPSFIKNRAWDLIAFFPSFSYKEGEKILRAFRYYNLNVAVEFDTRYVDGEVDFHPKCLPLSMNVILGKDERNMFSVPRVITTPDIKFVSLMTDEYWWLYGERELLEFVVEMKLEDFQRETLEMLTEYYSETDLLVFQEKLKQLWK